MSNSKVITRTHEPSKPLDLTFQTVDGVEAKFYFHEKIPGVTLLDLMSKMEAEASGAPKAIAEFIQQSLLDEENLEAWNAYASDPRNQISLDVLSEIVTWLAEKYSGIESPVNPTGQAGATDLATGYSPQPAAG
jgi:hypothetical protein